jgi:hypothetical protein
MLLPSWGYTKVIEWIKVVEKIMCRLRPTLNHCVYLGVQPHMSGTPGSNINLSFFYCPCLFVVDRNTTIVSVIEERCTWYSPVVFPRLEISIFQRGPVFDFLYLVNSGDGKYQSLVRLNAMRQKGLM